MTPAEIDASVRRRLAAGEDLYTLHEDALAGLDPDVILTQDLCRVCALPSGAVDAALAHLGCRADVVALDPYTLDEVLATITAVGRHLGVPARADERRRRTPGAAGRRRGPGRRAPPAPGGGGRVGGPAVHRRPLGARPGRGRGR